MNTKEIFSKNIYWVPGDEFKNFQSELKKSDFKMSGVLQTSCEALRAKGKKVLYASPSVFSRLCSRQGSWYRESDKNGYYMVVSESELPKKYKKYLNATISESDFSPETLPGEKDIRNLVNAVEYQDQKPADWENKGIKDSLMFKIMFTFTGFWGWGDNLKSHWLNHRGNHANFLSHQYTADIDGESVPYSVTDNDGVCSSCVEFFNIIDQSSRKMVRACPGSVTFAGVKRKVFYDVKPVTFFELKDVA